MVGIGAAFTATPPEQLRKDVAEIVREQVRIGIDIVNNGELGGNFLAFSDVLTGFELRDPKPGEPVSKIRSREMGDEFADFYGSFPGPPMGGSAAGMAPGSLRMGGPSAEAVPPRPADAMPAALRMRTVCTGPLKAKSLDRLQQEIAIFKDALKGVKTEEAFWCVIAPAWLEEFTWNEYYSTQDDFIQALSQAMAPIFRSVVDAGLILQLDDPAITHTWEEAWIPPRPLDEYHKFIDVRVQTLNAALQGIPEDRVRYHVCWGSWNGPHTQNIPLRDVIHYVLKVKAQCYSIEAAKSSHLHEWKVWQEVKLPAGKILMPGVIDHTSNVVEHAEVVADRIMTYANVVGRENVIAGTDCGMRGHAHVNWAKYRSIVEGAKLASARLWR
jgi:5-methyltetrahydropteroyltriglutamate--homocysteine methyltransferase